MKKNVSLLFVPYRLPVDRDLLSLRIHAEPKRPNDFTVD
jgi:hypothetical protein